MGQGGTSWQYIVLQKSRIRETPTLSTDADSRTDTNLKRSRDLSNLFFLFFYRLHDISQKKSRIRETKNLLTDADSRTDTNLKRSRDLSRKKKNIYINKWGG